MGQKKLEATLSLGSQKELLRTVKDEIDGTMTRIEFLESQLESVNGDTASTHTSQTNHTTVSEGTTVVLNHNAQDSTPLLPFGMC